MIRPNGLLIASQLACVLQLRSRPEFKYLTKCLLERECLLRVESDTGGARFGRRMRRALFHSHVHVGSEGGDGERAGVGDVPRASSSSRGGEESSLFGPGFRRRTMNAMEVVYREHTIRLTM